MRAIKHLTFYVVLGILSGCSGSDGSQAAGAASASFSLPLNSTQSNGWMANGGTPFKVKFTDAGTAIPGYTFQCKSGPASTVDGLSYSNCDGASGTLPEHAPTKDPSVPEGTYKTYVQVYKNGVLQETLSQSYYMHSSLDNVELCTDTVSDESYIEKAREFLDTGANFGGLTSVKAPFVKVEFSTGQVLEYRTLRKEFVTSEDQKLIAIIRRYTPRSGKPCSHGIGVKKHTCVNDDGGPGDILNCDAGGPSVSLECAALVFNAEGKAVCLTNTAGVATYLWGINMLASYRQSAFEDIDAGAVYVPDTPGFSRKTKLKPLADAKGSWLIYLPD